jgi:hypothetical protein
MPAGAGSCERLAWTRFASDPDELGRAAESIRSQAIRVSVADLAEAEAVEEVEDAPIVEGRILL